MKGMQLANYSWSTPLRDRGEYNSTQYTTQRIWLLTKHTGAIPEEGFTNRACHMHDNIVRATPTSTVCCNTDRKCILYNRYIYIRILLEHEKDNRKVQQSIIISNPNLVYRASPTLSPAQIAPSIHLSPCR